MIHLDLPQGSKAWVDARLGIPTSSQFHRIITPKTMKLSGSCDAYACELLAERLTGFSQDESLTQFMQRGRELEDAARSYYELQRDTTIETAGFCLHDRIRAGCSPDGFIGENGGVEIKTPSLTTHLAYLLGHDMDKYRCQVQGCLWITGREWWDVLSFNPELPPVITRHTRDDEFIEKLGKLVDQFVSYLDESQAKLEAQGIAFIERKVAA